MKSDCYVPEPLLFNPLKHHLGFIRDFANPEKKAGDKISENEIIKELRHLGNSVMDVYSGKIEVEDICHEILEYLRSGNLTEEVAFAEWAGRKMNDYRIVSLTDGSEWTVKYHDNSTRFVHIFPSRGSIHSFRVKSNTMKSAILYYIKVGKDYITSDDLNRVRPLLGLSPVKNALDTEAITEMIEILRNLN